MHDFHNGPLDYADELQLTEGDILVKSYAPYFWLATALFAIVCGVICLIP